MKIKDQFAEIKENNNLINIILKVTNDCNLNCPYCYNQKKSYKKDKLDIKDFEYILNLSIKEYTNISITFHGGEPLLMGKDWYKQVGKMVEEKSKKFNKKINLYLQSNGTLIDQEWIDIFKDNNIQVGLSFDGTNNDNTRKNTKKLVENFELLKENDILPSAALIIIDSKIDLIREYELFNKLGINGKFDIVFNADGVNEIYNNLNIKKIVKNYCDLFDYYVQRKNGVVISQFYHFISAIFDFKQIKNTCDNIVCNYKWVCIDSQGNMYPCGRVWPDNYTLGDIKELQSLKKAFESESYKKLIKSIINRMSSCQDKCIYYKYCQSGCPSTQFMNTNNPKGIDDKYCYYYKTLYNHIESYLRDINKPINNKNIINLIENNM
ncbi:MAG: radical SAM protein [archaeon]